ncbi:hypothetical protein [Cellulomonas fimi]|uniref:Uncharacterized protein n=1 Tax=Cellulomonas fimi TaxID=1708 RepID=A0A7Y0M0Z9_CELFI|nr:hypothetical protein [Cellulomonas fimi]NMR21058.1 hypothetical protein [Cellulomonas fimi]
MELALELIEHLGRVWNDYFLGAIRRAALAIEAPSRSVTFRRGVPADGRVDVALAGRGAGLRS